MGAKSDRCEKHLTQINSIAEEIGQEIEIDDDQPIAEVAKYVRIIRNVVGRLDGNLGDLKRPRIPIVFGQPRQLPEAFKGQSFLAFHLRAEGKLYVDARLLKMLKISTKDFETLISHELGHTIFAENFAQEGRLSRWWKERTTKFIQMVTPYNELFAGMSVLLAFPEDVSREAFLHVSIGGSMSQAESFLWDQRVYLNRKVNPGSFAAYEFFRGARAYLGRHYYQNASLEDHSLLMQVFIRSVEIHMNRRISRGEMQMDGWTALAPKLNREFIEIFDKEYKRSTVREETPQ